MFDPVNILVWFTLIPSALLLLFLLGAYFFLEEHMKSGRLFIKIISIPFFIVTAIDVSMIVAAKVFYVDFDIDASH